jgi:hypothetical protein
VALSVLGNNNASLIGVAISASLLPPAVNCGMALAFALFLSLTAALAPPSEAASSSSSGSDGGGYTCADFLALGGLSLALTLINIIAIFVAALAMFRLKEVAPVVNKVAFWNEDVKVCRGLNKQQKRGVAQLLMQRRGGGRRQRGGSSNTSAFTSGGSGGSFLPLSPLPFSSPSSYDFLSPHDRRRRNRHHRRPHRCDDLSADSSDSSRESDKEESVINDPPGAGRDDDCKGVGSADDSHHNHTAIGRGRGSDTTKKKADVALDVDILEAIEITNMILPSSSKFQLSTLSTKRAGV